jgi:hypothetical protein
MSGSIRAMTWFFLTMRVEVDHQILDLSGNLAADLHDHDGVEVSSRGDRGGEGTALDARGPILGGAPTALRVEVAKDGPPGQQRDERRPARCVASLA